VIEYKIDPITWYADRELKFCPKHFVTAETLLSNEAKEWVLEKLSGRFAIVPDTDSVIFLCDFLGKIAFEDPAEAMIYELTWS